MPFVEVSLVDAESGSSYVVQVPSADVGLLETDLSYATSLLQMAKSANQADAPGACVTPAPAPTPAPQATSEVFKWSHEAILLLVEEYRLCEKDMNSGKVSQKKVWERIGSKMKAEGHEVTGPQCLSKFNGMKRTYKSVKDHNSRSGNNLRAWPYTELMDSLMGEKPFMAPIATASSSSSSPVPSLRERSESESSCSSAATPNKRKRKAADSHDPFVEQLVRAREIAEANKKQRHEENTLLKRQLMEKLDKFLDQLMVRLPE